MIKFGSLFHGNEFFFMDHQINGKKILPGAAYLEMARAAVASTISDPKAVIHLINLIWLAPLVYENSPLRVEIRLCPSEAPGELSFEIYSSPTNDEEVIHCQGSAKIMRQSALPSIDLEKLQKQGWKAELQGVDCYRIFEKTGIDYGPGHRAIEKVYSGERQAFSKLKMPEFTPENLKLYFLHPSIVDAAFQSTIGLSAVQGGNEAMLPFAIDRMEIYTECTTSMWAWVRKSEQTANKFDIDLCDENGAIAARIAGLSLRSLQKDESHGLVYLEPDWMELELKAQDASLQYQKRLVVLCEPDSIAAKDVESALNDVRCIVLEPNVRGKSLEERYQAYGLKLMEEIQNLMQDKPEGHVLIQMIMSGQAVIQLFSGLCAILKSTHQENPDYHWQMLQFGESESKESILEFLIDYVNRQSDIQIKFENGKSWVKSLKEVRMPEMSPVIPWKDKGVYLITGGIGGLGRIIAQAITDAVSNPVLILTGRSPVNEEKEKWMATLEKKGATLRYYSADITDKKAVVKLIQEVVKKDGSINGIIHSAGVVKDSYLFSKNLTDVDAVFSPKISGLVNLDEASRDIKLDFFLFFSSITSFTGNPGQSDYAAANAFMDGYAKYRNHEVKLAHAFGKTVSIGWPLWQNGGMKVDSQIEKLMQERMGIFSLTTENGISALYQILEMNRDHVLVIEGDKNKIRKGLIYSPEVSNTDAKLTAKANAALNLSQDEMAEGVSEYFKNLLSKTLKLPLKQIDTDSSFDKYGMDSVVVMQLTNQLEQEFGSLSKTLFFEYNNINSISRYFIDNFKDKWNELLGLGEKNRALPENPSQLKSLKAAPSDMLKKMQYKYKPLPVTEKREYFKVSEIAIIGLAGKYPCSDDISEFWNNLKSGKDCITEIPESRWDFNDYYDENKNTQGKAYSKWGGFINGVDEFDPLFFNISPRESEYMDPQERLFLQCAYKTIEDAGYTRDSIVKTSDAGSGNNVGVFVGVMYEEYQLFGAQEQAQGNMLALGGSAASIANRVSYIFNFQGPSMALDTMCSSSLTAIHLACLSIERGDCDAAIAGGVNVSIHPNKYLLLSQGNFVSSKGRCESFGKGGDGYVPGEGVGAVLLKPLAQAVADGDHIYGVIKSTTLNAGGKTNGYTVPNPIAQGELIKKSFNRAGVNARAVSYIEAHGTGTSLGDPIEINGLTRAFESFTDDKQFCSIGSVKSNIGHCESASGIAALTKVLLQLKYRQLVPSLHSEELNPHIHFEKSPFVVQHTLEDWNRPLVNKNDTQREYPRIAGISSFGAGGSNAHMVIEEFIDEHQDSAMNGALDDVSVIILSAKDLDGLITQAKLLLNCVIQDNLDDSKLKFVAYTLQTGREAFAERIGFTTSSMADLKEKLTRFIDQKEGTADVYYGQVRKNKDTIGVLSSDEEMREALEKWIARKKYNKLLDFWVKGLSVDWNKLYGDQKPCKVSLPTYQFARERYWKPGQNKPVKTIMVQTKPELKPEPVIMIKEWEPKEAWHGIELNPGLIIILATKVTLKIAARLFVGIEHVQTLVVEHSETVKKGALTCNFYSGSSGEKLYEQLQQRLANTQLSGIIDITAFDDGYENSLVVEAGKIKFIQQIIEHKGPADLRLLQVAYQLNPVQIEKTTLKGARLAGLYRMLSAEYKSVLSLTLDTDCQVMEFGPLIEQIQHEYTALRRGGRSECCYRAQVRYEPYLKVSDRINDLHHDAHSKPFNDNDVILITGGTRGIGGAVAEYTASKGATKLVILGREKLPPASEWKTLIALNDVQSVTIKLSSLLRLADQGVEIQYYNTVLTDEKAVQKMVRDVQSTLGPITGVYHCAGKGSVNPAFIKKGLQEIEQICDPKIKGLSILYDALANSPIAFFVLFSSVSSVIPTLASGQGDYAMANSYMDYFAAHKWGEKPGVIKAVQWPSWGETGMAANLLTAAMQNSGLLPLSTRIGLGLLDYVRASSYRVCIPCFVQLDNFKPDTLLSSEAITSVKRTAQKPQQTGGNDARSIVNQWLKQVIMNELKLNENQVFEDKPFDEYGVDSIIIAQMTQAIQKLVPFTVSPSLFLENKTINDLAHYFQTHHAGELVAMLGTASVEQTEAIAPQASIQSAFTQTTPYSPQEQIAIVGIACRLPGASTKESFWDLLTQGKTAIRPVPANRWPQGSNRLDYGGWVDNIDQFDPSFFNMKDNDAAIMDPQARLILEESLAALYDAGYDNQALSGQKVGVYIGGRSQPVADMDTILQANNPILGVGQNYLATNISRYFNFNGPSLVVDTACSSGLMAMSIAAESLLSRRIDAALTGAVNLILNPFTHDLFAARNILSKTGEFHIFDKQSSGEVLGEGAGTVLLKRYSDAVKDGNKIYGVIKAIAVNNDGRTLGPGSPSLGAQKQVIYEALALSCTNVEDVGYIEVNGGGSSIVDSIEIKALSEVYQLTNQNLKPCYVGSIKPNVGHLLLTAGFAAFIRCVLSLYYKKVPPFLSAKDPFDFFPFQASRVAFNRESVDWKCAPGKKRIAVLNSFPDGGTNCNAVIEEFIPFNQYTQKYFSIPIPVMNKKSFNHASKESSSSKSISGNENRKITELKLKYRLKQEPEGETIQASIHNIWGKTK